MPSVHEDKIIFIPCNTPEGVIEKMRDLTRLKRPESLISESGGQKVELALESIRKEISV